jgi:hypothetical protein
MEPVVYGVLVFLAILLVGGALYKYWWAPRCVIGWCPSGKVCMNGQCAMFNPSGFPVPPTPVVPIPVRPPTPASFTPPNTMMH